MPTNSMSTPGWMQSRRYRCHWLESPIIFCGSLVKTQLFCHIKEKAKLSINRLENKHITLISWNCHRFE